MSCERRSGLASVAIVLLCVVPGMSRAASVELTVVDELGQPIDGLDVGLNPLETIGRHWPIAHGITDATGRIVLDGIGPGRYRIHARGARGRFVELDGHPAIRPPTITVEDETDPVVSRVRLVRGVPVVFRVSVDGDELPGATLVLRGLDHDYITEIPMRRIEREIRLVPGRWTVNVRPVPGYLLTAVEVNRSSLPGHVAELDLVPGDLAWYANFEFAAPATIWGYVAFRGESFGVRVVARLQQPGPWLDAARERGGSLFQEVSKPPRFPRWDYEMVVPDGRWQVTVEGDDLLSVEPPSVEVDLKPGEDRRIDFTIDGEQTEGPGTLTVNVRDPTGDRVGRAIVEVWPEEPALRGDQPLARERTRRWGQAWVRGLAEETFTVVAGRTGFVEGSALAPPRGRSDKRRPSVTVDLKRGVTVHTVASEDEQPIAGVEVVMTRLDEYRSLLASDEVAEWIRRPIGVTDETGHLWLRGVYPGRYRLTGTFAKAAGEWSFVEFLDPGGRTWSRELERSYVNEDVDEIEIRLAPAGGLRARVHCSDGTPLPEEADLLVLPADRIWTSPVRAEWMADSALHESEYVLEGRRRDELTIGPLETGAYHLLVRPAGHNRWTWAVGTESPTEAAVVSVRPGEPNDLGAIAVDCAPAVAVRPLPPPGQALPDLSTNAWFDPPADLTGTISLDDEQYPLGHVRTHLEPGRVQFRDLPEGEARLFALVRHPFFLPHPEVRVEHETTLERGKTVLLEPPVHGIGGAIRIRLPTELATTVVAARAIAEPAAEPPLEPRIWEVRDAELRIPSLAAGTYRVEICMDLACRDTRSPWGALEVVPAQFISP